MSATPIAKTTRSRSSRSANPGGICEKPGRFDEHTRAGGCPAQIRRILRLENLEALAVDGDRIVRMGYFVGKIAGSNRTSGGELGFLRR